MFSLHFKEQQLKTVIESQKKKIHFALCHHSQKLLFKLTLPPADQALNQNISLKFGTKTLRSTETRIPCSRQAALKLCFCTSGTFFFP